MKRIYTALGLMSGTSMDGIDAAIVRTDGKVISSFGPSITVPYDIDMQASLREAIGGVGDLNLLENRLTEAHAYVVKLLLKQNSISSDNIDIIGFHGHTILHRPDKRQTLQAGNGRSLAKRLGIDVVSNFRGNDIAAGGQGAPLAPLYHRALASEIEYSLVVLNIGGLANVSWIGPLDGSGDRQILAFDTGPGNALIDDWMLMHTGESVDWDGALASQGSIHEGVLQECLDLPYFDRQPPKSLDRGDFSLIPFRHLGIADGAATLVALSCRSVVAAKDYFPAEPKCWFVTGGGRLNPAIMAGLTEELDVPVLPVESIGWRGDALEAEAFAFLAVRSLLGYPLTLPETTGVISPQIGGDLHLSAS